MWNRRKDGSLFVSDMSISTISDTGKHITHYVGIFSDITQRKNAEERLQRMAYHDALNRPFYLNQYECRIGVSIGISLYPGDGEDRETLVKRADQAMYQAKRAGKNRFVFSGGAEVAE